MQEEDTAAAAKTQPSIAARARELEAYETDLAAAKAILRVEAIRGKVHDPCCGFGQLGLALREDPDYNRVWYETDVFPWWEERDRSQCEYRFQADFLLMEQRPFQAETLFMNPPFSKACEFVEHGKRLGYRKIVCFQRDAWWEAGVRANFWSEHPPNRRYTCRKRATCWRFDITLGETEKPLGNTPTSHSWFVWEEGHPLGTLVGHLDW